MARSFAHIICCEELSSMCLEMKWKNWEHWLPLLTGGFICAISFSFLFLNPHSFLLILSSSVTHSLLLTPFLLHYVFSSFVLMPLLAVLLVEPASVFLSGLNAPMLLVCVFFLFKFKILLRSPPPYIPLLYWGLNPGPHLLGKYSTTEQHPTHPPTQKTPPYPLLLLFKDL